MIKIEHNLIKLIDTLLKKTDSGEIKWAADESSVSSYKTKYKTVSYGIVYVKNEDRCVFAAMTKDNVSINVHSVPMEGEINKKLISLYEKIFMVSIDDVVSNLL